MKILVDTHILVWLHTADKRLSKEAKKDHKDPFDKMLISQAKTEGMFLLTHDELISNYLEECIIFV